MLGKIYERLLKHRLNFYLENRKFFHDAQYGFREGRSTVQILNKIKYVAKNYLKTHKYCGIVLFDIVGAFDNIEWVTLGRLISQLPIPTYLKQILLSFLTNREIITDV